MALSTARVHLLALEVRQQAQGRKEQKRRKRDAVEDADNDHGAQEGRGQDARALLHLVLAACPVTASGPKRAYLVLDNALDEHQAPAHQQRLEAVGKGVCLEGPRDVRRRDERHCDTSRARRFDQLVDGPVLHDDTEGEHEHAQRPVHDRGRHLIAKAL